MPKMIEVFFQYGNVTRTEAIIADRYRLNEDGSFELLIDLPSKKEEVVAIFNFDKVIAVLPERIYPNE